MINAIEIVKDRKTKEAFSPSQRIGWHIFRQAMQHGLVLRPIGDILYFNPPLIMKEETLAAAVDICAATIETVLGS